VSARKTKSTNSISKTQPRIPAEVTDSALISARLVQRIHRSLLMCHLLEARVAALGNKSAINRVHRGDGAMVVGATIGLGSRDIVITLGDTLLPHVTRDTPLDDLIRQLAQHPYPFRNFPAIECGAGSTARRKRPDSPNIAAR
jgi:hypothetical protein